MSGTYIDESGMLWTKCPECGKDRPYSMYTVEFHKAGWMICDKCIAADDGKDFVPARIGEEVRLKVPRKLVW